MDTAGNLLIADHSSNAQVVVYTPCGEPIKTIRTSKLAVDIEIGNNGKILVADFTVSKIFVYAESSSEIMETE